MAARLTAYVVVGIVAVTLIAGLMVGAQRDDSDGPVDLIVHNAKVYTADGRAAMAEAIAVRGNQILRVGSEREVVRLQRPQTVMIDARGAAVVPGFNDSHLHAMSGGLNLDRINVLDVSTFDEVQQRIRAWAEANPDARWVVGRGWSLRAFHGKLPTRQQLDAVVADRPTALISADGHASWVNSRALRLAGITRQTPNPPNGVIVRDARTGEATGVLKEAAMALVGRHVPAASIEDRTRAVRATIEEAHRYGVTSIQTVIDTPADLELLADMRRAGDLGLRVSAALSVPSLLSDAAIEGLDDVAKRHPDDPLFKAGALQIVLDGAVETETAAMLQPYTSGTAAGSPAILDDDLNRMVRLLDARGWQIMTHAVGDRAIRMALNAYEHAARSNPRAARGRRHRVEHVETTDEADVPRFGSLNVIASMQPYRGSPNPNLELWTRNVGPARAARGWAYGTIAADGGRLAFGSDWPAASLNPMLGLHTAVTRATPDNLPDGGWNPGERLTLKNAINAYTSGAAWASFDEQRKGSLAAGMLADLVVLSDDIFSVPAAALASTRVSVTIFDGKVVYRRDGRATN